MYIDYFTNLDFLVFFLVIGITISAILVGVFKSRSDKTFSSYMLMGRTLTLPVFIATLVATWYSSILGVTQISYDKGVYNILTQGVFWYFAAFIFAIFLVKKARKKNALTFPDMIGKIYGEKSSKLTSIIMLLNVLPVTGVIGLGIVLKGIFGFEIITGMIVGAALVGVYSLYGGFRSIVICDAIQLILMYSSVILVVVVSYNSFGGLEYLEANLPKSHFTATSNEKLSTVFVWFFMAICWTLLSPIFYHRCFAAIDYKTAKYGIFISIIFWMVCDIFTTVGGMYARAYMGDAPISEGYLSYSMQILPEGFRGLFLATVLCTVFSAIDSLLLLASAVFYHDLPKVSRADSKLWKFISMVVTISIAILIALFFDDRIENAMLTLQSIFMSVLLVPIIFGLIYKAVVSDKQFVFIVLSNFIISISWTSLGYNEVINIFYIGCAYNVLCMLGANLYNRYRETSWRFFLNKA